MSIKYIKFFSDSDDYVEFSNFYKAPFVIDGKKYNTVEHYYQSRKFIWDGAKPIDIEYADLVNSANTPNKAKILATLKVRAGHAAKWTVSGSDHRLLNDVIKEYNGKGVEHRPDWDAVKDDVMRIGLAAKFNSSARLKILLIETGDAEIAENSPYDKYWGIHGENKLGILLMELRDTIVWYQDHPE